MSPRQSHTGMEEQVMGKRQGCQAARRLLMGTGPQGPQGACSSSHSSSSHLRPDVLPWPQQASFGMLAIPALL